MLMIALLSTIAVRAPRTGYALMALAAIASACTPHPATAKRPEGIAWQPWRPAAFQRALAEKRLIVVDVGIEGCTACRDMHETFRDPAVVAWINANAVAISVDADVQPDLGERFDPWGWPAIGILDPSGQTLWMIKGARVARRFVAILDEVRADYLAGRAASPVEPPPDAAARDLSRACSDAVAWIDERGGDHGWGAGGVSDAPVELALARRDAFATDVDLPRARAHALGHARLLDPAWGGIFVAATQPDWTGFIPEKRTWTQAAALANFSLIAPLDASGQALGAASEIDRYLEAVMRTPQGLYQSTERDQIVGLPANLTAVDYYHLSGDERLKYGRPVADHAAYTAENAMVALSYLYLYRATGTAAWLERGRALLDAILATRLSERGFLRQATLTPEVERDRRLRPVVREDEDRRFLRPQVQAGFALVALHEATGQARYLEAAIALARQLEPLAAVGGGYLAADPRDTDARLPARSPAFDNAWAARFLLALHAATGDARYEALADGALQTIQGVRAAARSEGVGGASVYALALHERLLGAVDVAVTGAPDDPRARALRDAGYRVANARVFAHHDTAKKYPSADAPTAYVCTARACSSPLRDPAVLTARIAAALRAGDPRPCAGAGDVPHR
jgi:uncharacterized protein